MRILDIITFSTGRVIAQGDNGFLYSAAALNPDPFQALKRAVLDPDAHQWKIWEIGSDVDVDEIANRLRDECRVKFGFPFRVLA